MPVFVAKHNELKLQEQGQSADSDLHKTFDMLGTIKVPLNMNLIQKGLPSSNYETDKPAKKEKKMSKLNQENLQMINEENEREDH